MLPVEIGATTLCICTPNITDRSYRFAQTPSKKKQVRLGKIQEVVFGRLGSCSIAVAHVSGIDSVSETTRNTTKAGKRFHANTHWYTKASEQAR
jgi:hypothetical protein